MVYQISTYKTKEDFFDQRGSFIAFETDEKLSKTNINVCGKLLWYSSAEEEIKIPEGVETLGYSFLVSRNQLESSALSVYIPASVTKIEEGAFANSYVSKIEIHPDSPCGIVKDGGLYTKDGKTLLWTEKVFDIDGESGFVVADGTERIGVDSIGYDPWVWIDDIALYSKIVIPDSVKEIGYNEKSNNLAWDEITVMAPKGSYAIEFAKKHGIKFEEI